jgi:hypothetical protein
MPGVRCRQNIISWTILIGVALLVCEKRVVCCWPRWSESGENRRRSRSGCPKALHSVKIELFVLWLWEIDFQHRRHLEMKSIYGYSLQKKNIFWHQNVPPIPMSTSQSTSSCQKGWMVQRKRTLDLPTNGTTLSLMMSIGTVCGPMRSQKSETLTWWTSKFSICYWKPYRPYSGSYGLGSDITRESVFSSFCRAKFKRESLHWKHIGASAVCPRIEFTRGNNFLLHFCY